VQIEISDQNLAILNCNKIALKQQDYDFSLEEMNSLAIKYLLLAFNEQAQDYDNLTLFKTCCEAILLERQ